jgi:cytochrome c peroxidase
MGKAKCATCHFAPLFNGTTPPMYAESEVEVIGALVSPSSRKPTIDPDSGRHHVTRAEQHLHAFKVPTVRNVALTAPYMHNGAYRTLDEVVAFYNKGGGAGQGVSVPNQTLPVEQRALVAFMRALTDTVGTMPRAIRR